MKRKFTILSAAIALLACLAIPMGMWGQAAVNTVLWSEDFSGYSSGNVPSGSITNSHSGTTVYGEATLTYACADGGSTTKVFTDGGPNSNNNLLISKGNGTFTISGIPTGGATELTVSYAMSGSGTMNLSISTTGVTISGSSSGSTITTNGASTIDITFKNTGSSNLRADDLEIKVKTAGTPTTTHKFYTAVYPDNSGAVSAKDGNNNTISSGSDVAEEAMLTVTATAETGYKFSHWSLPDGSDSDVDDVNASPTSFMMGTDDVTLTANFATAYTVTCATNLSNGSISADMGTAVEGETVTITASPDAGYNFSTITVTKNGGGTIDADDIIYEGNTAAFEMPDDNVTVIATFTAKPTYSISLVAVPVAGGSVTTNVTDNLAYEDQIVTLTATPNTNYSLSALAATYDDGESTHDLTINGSNQFTMPAYPVTVTATFVEHHSYDIDFESTTYTDWEFTSVNSKQTNTNVTAHGGSYFGSTSITSGNNNSIIVTKNKIANPKSLTCYVTKQSTNTTTSTWYIEVSDDGSTWTEVTRRDAANMNRGEWVEFSATLISYHNVYVRVRYTGSTAVRNIDDLSLEYTPNEYAVNVSSVANGKITASAGTTTITEGNTANIESGKTVTLTAEGDATHMFSAWSVTGATVADASSATTTFEMPANAVTVSATFVDSWSFTYNINGNTVTEKYAKDEASITLPTTSEYCPEGYSIRGWTETESDVSSPITSATADQDRTFYAIFGKNVYGDFVKVTTGSTSDDWTGHYLIVYETGNVALNGNLETIDQEYNTISVEISNNKIVSNNTTKAAMFTIESNGVNTYSIRSAKGYYIGASSSGNLNNTDDKTAYQHSISAPGGIAAITCGSIGLKYNTSAHRFRYYSSAQQTIRLYKSELSLSGSYTRIYSSNEEATGDITIVSPTIIEKGGVLNMGSHTLTTTTAANLVIEDGGQLITSNAVAATVKKQVKGFNDTEDGGWKMIASPLSESNAFPSNLLSDGYIYKYDEASHFWRSNTGSAPFTQLTNKVGYLYGNDNDFTIEFAGTLAASNAEVIGDLSYTAANGDLAGWNLVGNPFACNAYTNRAYYVTSYDSEADNKTIFASYAAAQNQPIPPCTGILVKASATNEKVYFKNSSYEVMSAANNGFVQMNLEQQVVNRGASKSVRKDNAIVSFKEGDYLEKFVFNEDNAKLYIQQNSKDYAIAYSEGQGTMPVNFRAAENGTYTLTVNPEGVEMNYLHLIDNMTGNDIDLLMTPSYSFEATTNDYENRFRLVFAAGSVFEDENNANFAFCSNGNWIINNSGEATLQVIDLNGRILSSERVNGSVSKTINGTAGVYMLRLINGEKVMVQKIVVR